MIGVWKWADDGKNKSGTLELLEKNPKRIDMKVK